MEAYFSCDELEKEFEVLFISVVISEISLWIRRSICCWFGRKSHSSLNRWYSCSPSVSRSIWVYTLERPLHPRSSRQFSVAKSLLNVNHSLNQPMTYSELAALCLDEVFWQVIFFFHSTAPWETHSDVQKGIQALHVLGRASEELHIIYQGVCTFMGNRV
ncbi:hypothetical protein VP01_3397g1 [Puccinia sorghi]|uniref:Uncharacterized protein n=1 Tax=Puccinia sorghi TaxID=27349 RepID=A0A0L6UWR4_9BASI|nr:hypothetical protein VP01_3397g1 [Puccinia sorghi]